MKCEDCIHFDLCSEGYEHIFGNEYRNKVETVCKTFKNKSLFVELPCKVGDTVYRIRRNPYKAVLERTVVSVSICMNCKGNIEWRLFTTVEDTLGETVFLTREEAKKRLKELQNG